MEHENRLSGLAADTEALQRSLDETARIGDQFASRLTAAFEQIAVKGKSLDEVVRSLALSFSNLALNAALKPLEKSLGSVFDKMLVGVLGGGSRIPTPFAKGGVIASPITFPMGGGARGLAGERGAEAIMPLARGADGRLGVAMHGGGSQAAITVNITTPDVAGFKQSEAQIGAMLHRAIQRGQRNL